MSGRSNWPAAVAFALAGIFGGAGTASAQTYDAYHEFSMATNPNGTWSYEVAGQLLTKKLKNTCSTNDTKGFSCWWNGEQGTSGAVVGANKSGTTVSYETIVLPPRYLYFNPTSNSNVAAVWTAPAAGTVSVKGDFLGVDTGEASHTVAILHNGTVVESFTISSYQQKERFNKAFGAEAGDTVSFECDTNGPDNLSTAMAATITLK